MCVVVSSDPEADRARLVWVAVGALAAERSVCG